MQQKRLAPRNGAIWFRALARVAGSPEMPSKALAFLLWVDLAQEVPRGAIQALPVFPQ